MRTKILCGLQKAGNPAYDHPISITRPMGNSMSAPACKANRILEITLWAESYNRELRDILSLQEEVAGSIATLLCSAFLKVSLPANLCWFSVKWRAIVPR
jgi:hypothetical protein